MDSEIRAQKFVIEMLMLEITIVHKPQYEIMFQVKRKTESMGLVRLTLYDCHCWLFSKSFSPDDVHTSNLVTSADIKPWKVPERVLNLLKRKCKSYDIKGALHECSQRENETKT